MRHDGQSYMYPEGATRALGAVDTDIAVHHSDQTFADYETQTGAAIAAG